MALIVQKFGGTSVADIKKIKNVAKKVIKEKEAGNQVIVVVSAMSGVTNQLVKYTNEVSSLTSLESLAEYDSIVSSGEQVTSGLLALELQSKGFKSRSYLGWQAGIKTDDSHAKSRIEDIRTDVFKQALKQDIIPVVAGFQGVSPDNRISTMGRGGSDTSAVALAAALKADRCDIYTDVDGIYTADPRIVDSARKIEKLSYEEVIEMASLGAKVLQIRSVEMATKYGVKVQVRSSFSNDTGSILVNEEEIMEQGIITAVAHDKGEARITLHNVDNHPGVCAQIFKPLSDNNINVDMIIQNINDDEKKANVTFTLGQEDLKRALKILKKGKEEGKLSYEKLAFNENVAKISVIGVGMKAHPGIAQKTFQALADSNINILAITTSEIKISVLVDLKFTELSVRVLHEAFNLNKKTTIK